MERKLLATVENELKEEFAHIYQLKKHPHIILQEMKGICLPEELKKLHYEVIDLVLEHKFTHLVSVIIEFEGAFDKVNDWFTNVFNPKMVELGMTYEAIIQGGDIFSQLSAEELAENTELSEIGYHLRLFDSVEKGLEWFEEEKSVKK